AKAILRRRFASWRGNIIPTSPRTRNRRRRSLRISMKPTKCWATPPNGRSTTNWARTGNRVRNFVRRQGGNRLRAGAATVADHAGHGDRITNFISAAPASVTFLSNCLARVAVAALLAAVEVEERDSIRRISQPRKDAISRAISW